MKNIWNVNKILLPLKAHYFLFNAGTGSIVPFMSVFARQLGFSSVTVGIIYTISPFASMISKPTMGAISDRFYCKKIVFLAGILLTAIAVLLLRFAPSIPTSHKMRFSCGPTSSTIDTCVANFTIADECAVQSIINDIGEVNVNCQMTCSMDPSQRRTVCSFWNLTQYCDGNSNTFTFHASVSTNSATMADNCLYFNIEKIDVGGRNLSSVCPTDLQMVTDCDIDCDRSALNEIVANPTIPDDRVYSYHQFWVVMVIYIFIWIFQAVAVTNGDAICFDLLGDAPHKFGFQRCWGAIGWGTFTLLSGYLTDIFSHDNSSRNYEPAIYLGMVTLIVNFVVAFTIKYQQKEKSPNIVKDVGHLFINIRFIVFSIWCLFMGICTALLWNFLFWVVQDLARVQGCESTGWVTTLQGLMQVMQCLAGELPFFFLSGWILKSLGHINCMTLTTFTLGVRFMLYSIIKNPWWFLPVEITNGITFGLFYSTMTSYASIIAPPGTETTLQGAAGAIFEGIGVSLGSLLGGILIEKYGGPMTFRILSIAAFIFCFLHAVVQSLLNKWHVNDASKANVKFEKNLNE